MRNLILSALILASVFQTALGEQDGDWTYSVENNQATITGYTGVGGSVMIPPELNGVPVVKVGGDDPYVFRSTPYSFGSPNTSVISLSIPYGVTSIGSGAVASCANLIRVSIPNSVESIGASAFMGCTSLTSITIPNSVTSIGTGAFANTAIAWVIIPRDFITPQNFFSHGCMIFTPSLIHTLAENDAFVTAVANKIKATSGNYGIATQTQLTTTQAQLESTQTQLATTQAELATTKTQITTAINEGKASGIASVTASPNTWSLFTTSQIQNMAVDDLVLTRQVGGGFVLNYDIEQSTDLQTWTPYQALSLPLTGLPTDKAFVRIKAKQ
jgi:hypothetical protein